MNFTISFYLAFSLIILLPITMSMIIVRGKEDVYMQPTIDHIALDM